ncbi:MAG: Hpt domain-containing protein [Bacteriovoracaceae bacterium]|nr:Hpt domain-containing protein [Bacteriovoracaceae bacterium]
MSDDLNTKPKFFSKDKLLEIFSGDEILVDEALRSFAETLPDLLTPWEKSYKNKDMMVLGKTSHALKGAVLTFGCDSLAQKLSSLDKLCKQSSPWSEVVTQFQDVWAQIRILILELKNWEFKDLK